MTGVEQEYEQAKQNLYRAICARNPQLALFSSPTGIEGSAGRTAEPRERLNPGGEPWHDLPPLEVPVRDGTRQSCPAPESQTSGVVAAFINDDEERDAALRTRVVRVPFPEKGA